MIAENMKKMVAGSSVIRAMFEEGKRMAAEFGPENVFDFSLGNPSVAPPDSVRQAILNILAEENPMLVHGYMNNSGYEDVRQKIADKLNRTHGTAYAARNIIMTVGAAGALNITFKTILNPGDEVVVFAPYFGEYNNYVQNFGGVIVAVPPDTDTFQPDLDAFAARLSPKTKAVIINSPNNPTGVIYSEQTLKSLAAILTEARHKFGHPIVLVSDEPYRELVYGGVSVPYPAKFYPDTLVAYSYSKSLSLPGERIGYLTVPESADSFEELLAGLNVANRVLGFVNAPSLFQRVAAACVDAAVDVSVYEKNRNLLVDHLTAMGFSMQKPEGAFYIFPKTPVDDVEFANDAKSFNLLVVPGRAFGCPGHFRLAYCTSYDTCVRALPAFEKLAQKYKLKQGEFATKQVSKWNSSKTNSK